MDVFPYIWIYVYVSKQVFRSSIKQMKPSNGIYLVVILSFFVKSFGIPNCCALIYLVKFDCMLGETLHLDYI